MTRPSQRNMLKLCPSSQAPGYELGIAGPHISTGIAVDELLTGHLTGTPATRERTTEVAARHGVDAAEVADRVSRGLTVLAALATTIGPKPHVQEKLHGPMGEGTPDLFNTGNLVVLDWKSREGDHWGQLTHYAHSLRDSVQGIGRPVTMIIAWLAEERYEIREIDDAGLDAWEAEQRRCESQVGIVYRPDPETCPRCHRRLECPARDDQARSALAVLGTEIVPIEQAAARYPDVMQLEKYIKEYRAALKEAVIATGPIPVGDGREVAVTDTRRSSIDYTEGAKALFDHGWTRAEVDSASSLAIGKIETIAKAKVKSGKQKAADAVMAELSDAGALTVTISKALKMRKVRDHD